MGEIRPKTLYNVTVRLAMIRITNRPIRLSIMTKASILAEFEKSGFHEAERV